jgi:hypothetical protein
MSSPFYHLFAKYLAKSPLKELGFEPKTPRAPSFYIEILRVLCIFAVKKTFLQ